MSVLAYSELLKEITGINEEKAEEFFFRISNLSLSPLRSKCLKELVKKEKATVSSILKEMNETNCGGTYKSIKKFFNKLTDENIITKEKVGNRTYYKASKPAAEFFKYMRI